MSINYQVSDGVATLTMNRPDKKNALTVDMYAEMARRINEAASDPSCRCLLITGAGGAFTGGNDLKDFATRPPVGDDAPVFVFMKALASFEKPVVAAVQGVAVGIGTTMLLHCDLVYLADDAVLSMPFVRLGLVPEYASSLLLPLLAGQARATEKILLAKPFSAAEASAMGLATAVLPAAEVQSRAREAALAFNALPPRAVLESKRLLRKGLARQVAGTMQDEAAMFAKLLTGDEFKEAATAFFEKRKPDFSRCS